jgi:Zn-dependent metalloprotease
MKDPGTAYDDPTLGKDPQPGSMTDYVDTTDDNGGVHINSGIPNRAFYLTATAMGGFAWEKAGVIWYKALSRLRPTSNFQEAVDMTFNVAGEQFGTGSAEQEAVRTAWATVGLTVRQTRTQAAGGSGRG